MKFRTTVKNDLDKSEKHHKKRRSLFSRNRLKVLIFAGLITCKCGMGTTGKAVGIQKGCER